jgi:hypothetical protein
VQASSCKRPKTTKLRYLKRFIIESWFLPSSQTSGRMYNTVVSVKWMIWKVCRSPTLCRYWKTMIDFKWQKQGSQSSFRPLTGWGRTDSFENFSVKSLKRDYRMILTSTLLFSHWSIPLNIELFFLVFTIHRQNHYSLLQLFRTCWATRPCTWRRVPITCLLSHSSSGEQYNPQSPL